MKLRWQIILIALFSLSFPVVAWFSFSTLNSSYQKNIIEATHKQTDIILTSIQIFAKDKREDFTGYFPQLIDTLHIDGDDTEWSEVVAYAITENLSVKFAKKDQQLILFIKVVDASKFISNDQGSDQLIIAIGEERRIKKISIPRQAEGMVNPQFTVNNEHIAPEFTAYWHETATGYELEISLNNDNIKRIAVAAVDRMSDGTENYFGNVSNDQINLFPIIEQKSHWLDFLNDITLDGGQILLYDKQDRLLYSSNHSFQVQKNDDTNWLNQWLYESLFINSDNPEATFYGSHIIKEFQYGNIHIKTSLPDPQISLINSFIKALANILIIVLIFMLMYFLYALLLAWRIKRLNQNFQQVLDKKGKINTTLPSAKAKDEIGDLSRSMSQMLNEIKDYTQYLKQLGARLSHEMKTPLSIVQSSLENMQMDHQNDEFLERALQGTSRLKFILNQLSELSRLKQVISEADKQDFELNSFIKQMAESYQSTVTNLDYSICDEVHIISGSKDLLAQMLDKLIQNAMDFTSEHDTISIKLHTTENKPCLSVCNTGSQVEESNIPFLFDSLASFRTEKSKQPHLGIGLYVVKLIAEFHRAKLQVENLKEPQAVCFRIYL
ncbi:MAG: ATP-binding protein [Proteobacteria bacterium]|nr:ATP-binding protein [Pseudomonadota bacterium]